MRLVDFFFALRPLVLVPACSFFLLGWEAARADHGGHLAFPELRFLLFTMLMAGVYLANQVADYESDRLNAKGFFLQRGIFTRAQYVWVAVVLVAVSLEFAWIHGESMPLFGAAAALGLAYSVPPLRLSARPIADLLANGFGYGAVALLLGMGRAYGPGDVPGFPVAPAEGWSGASPTPIAFSVWWPRVAAAVLAVAAVFLHTTILDLEGDRRTGKRTTGVALGMPLSRAVAAAAGLGAALVAFRLEVFAPLRIACAALAALGVTALLRPKWVSSRTVCVAATAAFAVAAGVPSPAFLGGLLVLAVATRIYYQKRFALAYPAL
jgi:chlorophyll synthase